MNGRRPSRVVCRRIMCMVRCMLRRSILGVFCLLGLFSLPLLHAQSASHPKIGTSEPSPVSGSNARLPLLFVNARALLPGGIREGVRVLIEDGYIAGVDPEGDVPANARVIDLDGAWLTPGIVDPDSTLGLVEVSAEKASVDMSSGRPIHPAFDVLDAYNPRSAAIPVARLGGVTSALVAPRGGVMSGQSIIVDLAGRTQAEALVKHPAAVHFNLQANPASSRAETLRVLRDMLEEARIFQWQRSAWERNSSRPFTYSAADLEALGPVLEADVPLIAHADRASDIEALVRMATAQKIRLIIAGGAEGYLVRDILAAAHVPVILDTFVDGPGSFDQVFGRPDNAALLYAAGVPIMFSTFSAHNLRELPQYAGNAVRAGLPFEAALRALTETPSDVFGLPRSGRIQEGYRANLVVWSGDPLEFETQVLHVLIRGREMPLISRQTRLFERYRTLPGTPNPPPPLP